MQERAALAGGRGRRRAPRRGRGTTIELRLGASAGAGMRVLIADDHGVVRGGLRLLLDRQPGIEVVGEAADGAEAVERDAGAAARPARSSTSRCRS